MFYIFLSIAIFILSFKRKWYKYLYFIAIVAFILGGRLNKSFFPFSFLSPSEWTVVILFIVLLSKGLALKRSYILNVTLVDRIYIFFIFCAIIIPIVANFSDLDTLDIALFKFFVPLKVWVVYRIFYCLLFESYLRGKLNEDIDLILNLVLLISAMACLVGILSLLSIAGISDLINYIWIMVRRPRLSSTMGGINTGALFFAICAIISIFQYIKHNKTFYLIYFSVFMFSVILTGSLSAMITLIFAITIFSMKYLNIKRLIITLWFLAIFSTLCLAIEPIKNTTDYFIKRRIRQQFQSSHTYKGIIPSHLVGRYRRWVNLYDYFMEKPIFGYGPKGVPEISSTRVYTHSYYAFLTIYSGILGLLAYLFMNYKIVKKLRRLKQFKHEGFLIILIISMYLVSQISQLSFQYAGLSELFGILLALTALMIKYEIRTDRDGFKQ